MELASKHVCAVLEAGCDIQRPVEPGRGRPALRLDLPFRHADRIGVGIRAVGRRAAAR